MQLQPLHPNQLPTIGSRPPVPTDREQQLKRSGPNMTAQTKPEPHFPAEQKPLQARLPARMKYGHTPGARLGREVGPAALDAQARNAVLARVRLCAACFSFLRWSIIM